MDSPLQDVAHVIQLSVAPVFLLTSLGTFLGVLSTRLARIVDRARVLADRTRGLPPAALEPLNAELELLVRRRHLVNLAIGSGVTAALLVCLLIASAFIGAMMGYRVSTAVALLFVAALVAFVAALVAFLREVLLAVGSVHIGPGR